MTASVAKNVPPRVVKAVGRDLENSQWQCEPLAVNFKTLSEMESFYKTAVSVALAVKKEILEWKGGERA